MTKVKVFVYRRRRRQQRRRRGYDNSSPDFRQGELKTWHEARTSRPLPSLWGFFCFVKFKFVFFRPIRNLRWSPWPLIGWFIFDFFSETAERNLLKLDRKEELNVLYQVCLSRRSEIQYGYSGCWLAETFWTFLWNCCTEFAETWQDARSQRPLPSLCFSGRSENKDSNTGLWLAETFSTSSLKLLNGICWNLTGSRNSTSASTKMATRPLISWYIFDFSSDTV